MPNNFNGSSYIKDPETGFLAPNGPNKVFGFGPSTKIKLLEYLENDMNLNRAAKHIGVSRATLSNHLMHDQLLREKVEELREGHLDDLEGEMLIRGKKGSFIHSIAYLKAYRHERWGDRRKVEHNIDPSLMNRLADPVANAKPVDVQPISDLESQQGEK